MLHLGPLKTELGAMHLAEQPSSRRPRAAGSTAATAGNRCLCCFPLLLVVFGAQERLVLMRVILHLGRDVDPAAVGRARKQVGVWVGSQTTRIRSFMADFCDASSSNGPWRQTFCDASSSNGPWRHLIG